eukprot:scaffold1692_cov133-Isochrysis_galbana.AAC.5
MHIDFTTTRKCGEEGVCVEMEMPTQLIGTAPGGWFGRPSGSNGCRRFCAILRGLAPQDDAGRETPERKEYIGQLEALAAVATYYTLADGAPLPDGGRSHALHLHLQVSHLALKSQVSHLALKSQVSPLAGVCLRAVGV